MRHSRHTKHCSSAASHGRQIGSNCKPRQIPSPPQAFSRTVDRNTGSHRLHCEKHENKARNTKNNVFWPLDRDELILFFSPWWQLADNLKVVAERDAGCAYCLHYCLLSAVSTACCGPACLRACVPTCLRACVPAFLRASGFRTQSRQLYMLCVVWCCFSCVLLCLCSRCCVCVCCVCSVVRVWHSS